MIHTCSDCGLVHEGHPMSGESEAVLLARIEAETRLAIARLEAKADVARAEAYAEADVAVAEAQADADVAVTELQADAVTEVYEDAEVTPEVPEVPVVVDVDNSTDVAGDELAPPQAEVEEPVPPRKRGLGLW